MTSSPTAPRSRKTPLEAAIASPITLHPVASLPVPDRPVAALRHSKCALSDTDRFNERECVPKVQSVERIHGKENSGAILLVR
jgi:hypothetical protein